MADNSENESNSSSEDVAPRSPNLSDSYEVFMEQIFPKGWFWDDESNSKKSSQEEVSGTGDSKGNLGLKSDCNHSASKDDDSESTDDDDSEEDSDEDTLDSSLDIPRSFHPISNLSSMKEDLSSSSLDFTDVILTDASSSSISQESIDSKGKSYKKSDSNKQREQYADSHTKDSNVSTNSSVGSNDLSIDINSFKGLSNEITERNGLNDSLSDQESSTENCTNTAKHGDTFGRRSGKKMNSVDELSLSHDQSAGDKSPQPAEAWTNVLKRERTINPEMEAKLNALTSKSQEGLFSDPVETQETETNIGLSESQEKLKVHIKPGVSDVPPVKLDGNDPGGRSSKKMKLFEESFLQEQSAVDKSPLPAEAWTNVLKREQRTVYPALMDEKFKALKSQPQEGLFSDPVETQETKTDLSLSESQEKFKAHIQQGLSDAQPVKLHGDISSGGDKE